MLKVNDITVHFKSQAEGAVSQQWEQFIPTSGSWHTTWMRSERKIPRFWVTSEHRGSEWRREAGDGRDGGRLVTEILGNLMLPALDR